MVSKYRPFLYYAAKCLKINDTLVSVLQKLTKCPSPSLICYWQQSEKVIFFAIYAQKIYLLNRTPTLAWISCNTNWHKNIFWYVDLNGNYCRKDNHWTKMCIRSKGSVAYEVFTTFNLTLRTGFQSFFERLLAQVILTQWKLADICLISFSLAYNILVNNLCKQSGW